MKYAYKGYLICHNELNGLWWIECNGQYIATARDRTDGIAIVNMLIS